MSRFLVVFVLLLSGCTQVTLKNGDSTATYKGLKVFSPTVLSLRSGQCTVPSVDAGGIVTEPTNPPVSTGAALALGPVNPPVSPSDCTTTVASVNGVDVKGLVNVILSSVLAGIAAG